MNLDFLYQFVSAFLITQLIDKSSRYWIGLNDVDGDNLFQWNDNSKMAYTNWDVNAPKSQQVIKVFS